MKFNKKNIPFLFLIMISCILIGSLFWEILERMLHYAGLNISFTMKEPIKLFDIYVIALSFRANPGSIIGFISSFFLYLKI